MLRVYKEHSKNCNINKPNFKDMCVFCSCEVDLK